MTAKATGAEKLPAPWHDTVLCEVPDCGGPIVPFHYDRPQTAPDVRHVKCAACGFDHVEDDIGNLVRIWWSAGAWEGREMKP